ncbi:MAG: helix-turn-helix transcriptional regulator [Labilithrix sp.]|nr:helix-turn-helix transcriptional regulator [Labilithrix sp.]
MGRTNVIRAASAVEIVEAAYDLSGSEAAWLRALLDVARSDLDVGSGLYAFTGDATNADPERSQVFAERALVPAFRARLLELNETAPTALFDVLRKRHVTCGGLEQVLGAGSPTVAQFRQVMAVAGVVDGFCMFAQDAQGGSVTVASPAPAPVKPSPRVRGIWQRVGLHVVAGLRLRRKLAARATRRDALLSPSGKLEDASATVADDDTARRALGDAVRAMEQARSAQVRASPERALELWRGLVAGQWSLVDHWEQGGRRYIAAYANQPGSRDPRALTASEQSVLRYVALGATNKEASYALGLSEKTVSGCVTQIMKKLRFRTRVDLAVMLDAPRAVSLDLSFAEDRLEVISVDVGAGKAIAERLTVAEHEVAEYVARGVSNARIAAARGVATSTVAKQLQTIYDKLGVSNRSQLARAVAGNEPRGAP